MAKVGKGYEIFSSFFNTRPPSGKSVSKELIRFTYIKGLFSKGVLGKGTRYIISLPILSIAERGGS